MISNFFKTFITEPLNLLTRIFQKSDRVERVLQLLEIVVGGYFLLYTTIFIIKILRRLWPRNLLSRYGPDSWAVVTGGSDGIGRGFCEELAKKGFNVVLIARNKEKLEKVAKEIQGINPKIKTRIVVANFSESAKPGFFDQIYKQVEDLDISILVNNVGFGSLDYFHKVSEEEIRDLININIYPMMMLTHKFINKLRLRKYKSGIINISSSASMVPMPYLAPYASTKALNDQFSRSLAVEYPEIDILTVRPFYVSTVLNNYKEISIDTITPNQCAWGSLMDLGRESVSYAHWKHDLMAFSMKLMPGFIRNYLVKNIILPKELKRKEEAQKKKSI